MADNWYTGNAAIDGAPNRGWILGHFIDPETGGVLSSDAVEVKWGVHPAGETRPEWTVGDHRTTLLILIEGRWRLDLSVRTVILEKPGDYAVWGPGIDHSWHAEEDSVMLTVRWPSSSLESTT